MRNKQSWIEGIVTCALALLVVTHRSAAQDHIIDDFPGVTDESTTYMQAQDVENINIDELEDFGDLSLEQLMGIDVISVTRTRGQSLFTSPAAIAVITSEDIRRSGLRTLPELLRLVPGMHVAQIDANKWAISSRGFTGRFNPYQLVQMDGRTLYTPAFSGVNWSAQDILLEDIDRIEVIRGPGATLWGSNAVNGIINIVTKSSRDTQGLFISGGIGSHDTSFGSVRYGGKMGENAYFRIYGKADHFDDFKSASLNYTDDWRRVQGGFRMDWEDGEDTFTIQGDTYDTSVGELIKNINVAAGTTTNLPGTHQFSGWNILTRWNRELSEDSGLQFQLYYDWTRWEIPYQSGTYRQDIGQFDIDFQHNFEPFEDHRLVWGVEYRNVDADFRSAGIITVLRSNPTPNTFSGFVQDTIPLGSEKLELTLGTKLEHNDFTGFEVQPSVKLLWKPDEKQILWGGVSRAVRVPSFGNTDVRLVLAAQAPGVPVTLIQNPDLKSEEVIAYELGYRIQPNERFVLDLATFYNMYHDLTSLITLSATEQQSINGRTGDAYGFEMAAKWHLTDTLRLDGSYTFFHLDQEGGAESIEDDSPRHQFSLRSHLDVTNDLELNGAIYYYDKLASQGVPAFTRLDVGLTWRPEPNVEISLWGQNLLDPEHEEFGPDGFLSNGSALIERGLYAQVTIRF